MADIEFNVDGVMSVPTKRRAHGVPSQDWECLKDDLRAIGEKRGRLERAWDAVVGQLPGLFGGLCTGATLLAIAPAENLRLLGQDGQTIAWLIGVCMFLLTVVSAAFVRSRQTDAAGAAGRVLVDMERIEKREWQAGAH